MNIVPKILYQAWEGGLPKCIRDKNKLHLPENIDYKLFTLKDMYVYLRDNWGERYVNLFLSYNKIVHKTDLWRYCILYDTGGIYMDVDCILVNNIKLILNYDLLFVTNNRGVQNIFNGLLMTPPKHPIYQEILYYLLHIGTNFNNDYYFNCKMLYNIVNKYINIKLTKHVYSSNINNVNYKILLLIDKKLPEINIGKWVEYNRYCPCYYDIPLLIECNKYYPYKKHNTTTKRIIKN
jgi:hypothetical protein